MTRRAPLIESGLTAGEWACCPEIMPRWWQRRGSSSVWTAPIPAGADTVVQVELTRRQSGGTTLILEEHPRQKNIRLAGEDISAGYTFADAIAKHPGAFNSMYIAVAHSGEIAGALDRVLDELATYMESMEAMRAKVKGAMRYPSFVLGFVTLLVIGIMWKLAPIFSNMYAGMGAQLPMPTQILVTISDLIVHNILIVLFLGIAAVVGLKVAIAKDDRVKLLIHKLLS